MYGCLPVRYLATGTLAFDSSHVKMGWSPAPFIMLMFRIPGPGPPKVRAAFFSLSTLTHFLGPAVRTEGKISDFQPFYTCRLASGLSTGYWARELDNWNTRESANDFLCRG